MNQIRAIQALNKRELENGIPPEASWHTDYRDTAFVYFGGLPYALSEGDIIVIFSQYGEPVFVKLARDKETGKSKGFGWLKYRDQRSTDLAVDNLGGADILGRVMRVDHARYKPHEDDDPEEGKVDWESMMRREGKSVEESEDESEEEKGGKRRVRGMLEEEKELAKLLAEHDEDDPMKAYLIDEKKKEVAEAKERRERKEKKERHRHHKSRRSRRHESEDAEDLRRERRERYARRESLAGKDSRWERGSHRRSPTEEPGNGDKDPYDEEQERRRDKERRRGGGDDDDVGRERRRRRERDDSRDRRRDRDDRDRHRKDRRRSRSP